MFEHIAELKQGNVKETLGVGFFIEHLLSFSFSLFARMRVSQVRTRLISF